MYSRLTVKNRYIIKKLSHETRFVIALRELSLKGGENVLDYGTGDGYLLKLVLSQGHGGEIWGYEPRAWTYLNLVMILANEVLEKSIRVTQSLDGLPRKHFNRICCLEVLEHLTESNQRAALRNIRALLAEKGSIIISVPIETGLSSLAKNCVRLLLGQPHRGTNPTSIIKSLFAVRINRKESDYMSSHIGFNFHDLEKVICSEQFTIVKKVFSPIRLFGAFLNSQVIYVIST